jgi:hypothetical protein
MARLLINHPLPGDTVVSQFVAAQGDGDPSIRNVVGIIWDSMANVVAVGMAIRNPPQWIIGFTDIPAGLGYCLEVIDANTKERLACSGPFDVTDQETHGPEIYYPLDGATVNRNMSAYGYDPGNSPVQGRVQGPGGFDTGWIDQMHGPPGSPNWIVSFTNLKLDATHSSTFTVREKNNPSAMSSTNNISID